MASDGSGDSANKGHDCRINNPMPQYRVAQGGGSITFFPCDVTSTNRNDVKNRYCALCHRFIGDMWRPGDDPDRFYYPRTK